MSESGEEASDTKTTSSSSSASADWPVTEEWLQSVLRSHHGGKEQSSITIVDFNVKPGCDSCDSVLSDILAVFVKYSIKDEPEQTHNLNFIVKLLPQDPFSRFFVTEAQFDLREIKFYTEVVPDLESLKSDLPIAKLPIPKCYYAHYNPGTNEPEGGEPTPPESVLVLENIKPSGYSGCDFSKGLDMAQTSAAIDSIAQIHALSLALKIKKGGKSLSQVYPFLFQTNRASDSYQQLVEKGLPQLTKFLEKRQNLQEIDEALNQLRPHTKEIIENLLAPEEPLALITHTDFWCNNLMFKTDENGCRCAILDWQMVTYSRPTNDLALLLVSSVPAELRRTQTEEILDGYFEKFVAISKCLGVNIEEDLGYTRKKLGEDYKRSQLLALLLCIGSIDLALGNEQMEERLVSLLQDLYKNGLLNVDLMKKD